MQVPTAKDLWYADNNRPCDFTARKGRRMGFNIDDRLFPNGEQPMAIKVTFYDGVAETLKLVYENEKGFQEKSVTANGSDKVRTATFFINAHADNTGFDHDFDFLLESENEVPVFFVHVIKTKEIYTATYRNIQLNDEMEVFPNPFSNQLNIKLSAKSELNYKILDLVGRPVKEGKLNHSEVMSTSEWEPGIYLLKAEGKKTVKLIKK